MKRYLHGNGLLRLDEDDSEGVRRCLRKRAPDRYPDAKEMVRDNLECLPPGSRPIRRRSDARSSPSTYSMTMMAPMCRSIVEQGFPEERLPAE
jgi:hypothetical protein